MTESTPSATVLEQIEELIVGSRKMRAELDRVRMELAARFEERTEEASKISAGCNHFMSAFARSILMSTVWSACKFLWACCVAGGSLMMALQLLPKVWSIT